jgi:predicted component of type VI protein secretion system
MTKHALAPRCGAALIALSLALTACSSSKPASASAAGEAPVTGVALPSNVSVVTANNAN